MSLDRVEEESLVKIPTHLSNQMLSSVESLVSGRSSCTSGFSHAAELSSRSKVLSRYRGQKPHDYRCRGLNLLLVLYRPGQVFTFHWKLFGLAQSLFLQLWMVIILLSRLLFLKWLRIFSLWLNNLANQKVILSFFPDGHLLTLMLFPKKV